MGTLLQKIQSQKAADSADLRKTSCEAISACGKIAESCGFENELPEKSANPQTRADSKPLPHKDIRKSANPHDIGSESKKSKSRLVRLTIDYGIDHGILLDEKEIAALVPPSDWRDASNCTTDELKAWAAALAMRAVRYRGKVPHGWNKVAHCVHCGPVHSFHDMNTLSCGWCELRLAGKWFPVPVVGDKQ